MSEIKPIETIYNGYRFRSRLEARWAVFFDAVGIKYQYEPEGFDLGEGLYYLPDFYLPELHMWAEIKGRMSSEDLIKIEKFRGDADEDPENYHLLITLGNIPDPAVDLCDYCNSIGSGAQEWEFEINYDHPYLPCICPACGKAGFEFDGRGWRVCGGLHKNKNGENLTYEDESGNLYRFYVPIRGRTDDKGYTYDHPDIIQGYRLARTARFEYGETPRLNERRVAPILA